MMANGGVCEDCGAYWTERAGGLNEHGQCRMCADRYPVTGYSEPGAVNTSTTSRNETVGDQAARSIVR